MNESLEFLNFLNNPKHWYMSEREQIGEGRINSIDIGEYKGICIDAFCKIPISEQLVAFDSIFSRCDLRGMTLAQLIHGTKEAVHYYYLFTNNSSESNSPNEETSQCMECIDEFIFDFKLNFSKCNIRTLTSIEIQSLLETMEEYTYGSILEGVPGNYTDVNKLTAPERLLELLDGEEFMMLVLANQLDYTLVGAIEQNLQLALNLLNPLLNQVTIFQTTESMNTAVQAHSNESNSFNHNYMEGEQRKAIQLDVEGEKLGTRFRQLDQDKIQIKEIQFDQNTLDRLNNERSCSSGINANKSNEQRKVCITNCNTNNICAEGWAAYIREVMAKRLTVNMGAGIFRYTGGVLTNTATTLHKIESIQLAMYRRDKDNKVPLHHHRVDVKHPIMRQIKQCQFPKLFCANQRVGFSNYEQLGGVLFGQLVTPTLLYGGNWISNRELSALYIIPEIFGLNYSNNTISMQSISPASIERNERGNCVDTNFLLIGKREYLQKWEEERKEQTLHYATYLPSKQQAYFNPFELYRGELISHRIDLLKAIFHVSFHLQPMELFVLEQVIYECYKAHGWNLEANRNTKFGERVYGTGVNGFPTLGEVLHRIQMVENSGANSAMSPKLLGLLCGRKGVVYNQPHSMDLRKICNQKTRIEIDGICRNSELRFFTGIVGIQLIECYKQMNLEQAFTIGIQEFQTIYSEKEWTSNPQLEEEYTLLKEYIAEVSCKKIKVMSLIK